MGRGEGQGMKKFLVDTMLGRLAKELRMLGYDTIYYRGQDFHELLHIARQEERVVLTRNTKLTAKGIEARIILIKKDHPLHQLEELLNQGISVVDEQVLFSRCLLCNALLDKITRENAEGKVPDFVYYQQVEFYQCPQCHRIYWPGSHQERMEKRIRDLFGIEAPRLKGGASR